MDNDIAEKLKRLERYEKKQRNGVREGSVFLAGILHLAVFVAYFHEVSRNRFIAMGREQSAQIWLVGVALFISYALTAFLAYGWNRAEDAPTTRDPSPQG